ncbi:MAG: DinB superfamily protein [Gemmatimonadales bacterium]
MSRPVLASAIAGILARDLRTLCREVEAYPDERQLRQEVPGIPNSAGTLVLHLTGNVQHYVGARLGASGYVRDRPAEFARREVPRLELLQQIAATEAVLGALTQLVDAQLQTDFPEVAGGRRVVTGDYLVHLVSHFAYDLGQLDYHRRVVTGQYAGVAAVRPAELSTARAVPE